MDVSDNDVKSAPMLSAGMWLTLREKLAVRVNGAAGAVEPGHLVSGYYSEDPMDRGRLLETLEHTFKITLDVDSFEAARTVQELASLIASRLAVKNREEDGRSYFVVYRDRDGEVVETHVRARNHEAAVESLRGEGLEQVLSVQRAEDEDEDPYDRGTGRAVRGHLLPILVVMLGAAAAVAYFWFKYRH